MTSWLRYLTHISNSMCPKWTLPNVAFKPDPDTAFLILADGNHSLLGVSSEILGASRTFLILLSITCSLSAGLVSSTGWIVQNLITSHHLCFYSCSRANIVPSLSVTKTSQQFSLLPTVDSQKCNLSNLRIEDG